jgi:hypothetical protein
MCSQSPQQRYDFLDVPNVIRYAGFHLGMPHFVMAHSGMNRTSQPFSTDPLPVCGLRPFFVRRGASPHGRRVPNGGPGNNPPPTTRQRARGGSRVCWLLLCAGNRVLQAGRAFCVSRRELAALRVLVNSDAPSSRRVSRPGVCGVFTGAASPHCWLIFGGDTRYCRRAGWRTQIPNGIKFLTHVPCGTQDGPAADHAGRALEPMGHADEARSLRHVAR